MMIDLHASRITSYNVCYTKLLRLAEVMEIYGPRLKFTRMTRSELAKVRNRR